MPLLNKYTAQQKTTIVVIDGGNRAQETCPGLDGKTKMLAQAATEDLPDHVEIDYIDLAVKGDGNIVQPCKGCIGTAGGYHCHYPCDCYGKGSGSEDVQDFMHNEDVYGRLERADGFVVFSPINWYSTTTQVKAMFDRLVCVHETLTHEQSDEFNIGKDPKVSKELAEDGTYDDLLELHYEGKFAAFFIHGDSGADDFSRREPPRSLQMYVEEEEVANNPKNAISDAVNMCRYSGIFVPSDLIYAKHINEGIDYAVADSVSKEEISSGASQLVDDARSLILRLVDYIENHEAMVA